MKQYMFLVAGLVVIAGLTGCFRRKKCAPCAPMVCEEPGYDNERIEVK